MVPAAILNLICWPNHSGKLELGPIRVRRPSFASRRVLLAHLAGGCWVYTGVKKGVFEHYIKNIYENSLIDFFKIKLKFAATSFLNAGHSSPCLRSRTNSDPTIIMTEILFAQTGIFLSYRLWSRSHFLTVKSCHLSCISKIKFIFSICWSRDTLIHIIWHIYDRRLK